jgi:hypothetical protein
VAMPSRESVCAMELAACGNSDMSVHNGRKPLLLVFRQSLCGDENGQDQPACPRRASVSSVASERRVGQSLHVQVGRVRGELGSEVGELIPGPVSTWNGIAMPSVFTPTARKTPGVASNATSSSRLIAPAAYADHPPAALPVRQQQALSYRLAPHGPQCQ